LRLLESGEGLRLTEKGWGVRSLGSTREKKWRRGRDSNEICRPRWTPRGVRRGKTRTMRVLDKCPCRVFLAGAKKAKAESPGTEPRTFPIQAARLRFIFFEIHYPTSSKA
jgi:hypothetical protein